MATVENYWAKNFDERSKNEEEEELLVFGYSCKLFRDDEKALYIDQGRHLIPWMNDDSLMIDRYDVRGYLHDLTLYEPKADSNPTAGFTPEEKRIEQICDEERYLALRKDLTEEQMYHEEELKRLKAALASDGAYHEIGFTYENEAENTQSSTSSEEIKEEADEQYVVPQGLTLPNGIQLPPTMKLHTIIEKTALFVAQHGGQMEIIIKMKQSSNPQFDFLSFDHALNPYYKHLVSSIKSGKYVPLKAPVKDDDDDDDDPDGHYLHPSLFAAKSDNTPMSLPNIQFRCDENDAYSLLVKNLKNKLSEPKSSTASPLRSAPPTEPARIFPSQPNLEPFGMHRLSSESSDQPPPPGEGPALLLPTTQGSVTNSPFGMLDPSSHIIPPPPDVQPIIDKMATYVAKNGDDFETIVKSKGDKRFEFLLPWHEYHSYYLFKKHIYSEQKKRENLSQQQIIESANISDQDSSKDGHDDDSKKSKNKVATPVSFSIKAKDMDTLHLEKKKTILLLDDDSGEEHEDKQNSDSKKTESEEIIQSANPVISPNEIAITVENEEKPRKLTQEELEAKLAEEKLKDKLAAAAREKLAQQSRDRQLQLERKRKAALFLNKLKDSGPVDETAVQSESNATDSNDKSKQSPVSSLVASPSDTHDLRSPFLSLPSSPLPTSNENDFKSSSGSRHGDSERLARFLAESGSLSIQKMKSRSRRRSPSPRSHHKHHYSPSRGSSKSKKRSRSKSRSDHKKRSRSRSKSRSHKKRHKSSSKSPSKSKDDRSKTPPAAYSLIRRSKTRSPSPRRYRYGFPMKHKSRRK
ncbi:splicing factor, suppressor of white-apricot homolog [Centruroides sculpturatus]|uniref:splicing factor, suppressor of white-apricot homolog n=1 Tax=Centruroides sculpturatus TaxID=218467 RepID=UPI000C6D07CF|nr:splicing factor, suppressor of white-apricot homolog [Centruroides sculpturatus]